MSRTTPNTEPQVLVAGDSWNWNKTLASYPPAEGWTLGYSIRGASTLADSDVVTATSGTGYTVTVNKAKTAALVAGSYLWNSYVDNTSTGEHYTVESGVITVLPNLNSYTGSQGQAHVERTLALIEVAIEGRLSKDFESYSINGRAIAKIPIKQLVALRATYQAKLYRLQNPGSTGPKVLIQHTNTDGVFSTTGTVVFPPWYRALLS